MNDWASGSIKRRLSKALKRSWSRLRLCRWARINALRTGSAYVLPVDPLSCALANADHA